MVNPIPDWLAQHLDETGRRQVEAAIAASELRTSGEIVPMVVHRSSSVSLVPVVVFLGLSLFFILIDQLIIQTLTHLVTPSWFYLIYILAALILARFLGELPLVQRGLLELSAHEKQVRQRAEAEFYRAGLQKTDGSTGVLIFVSFTERQAVILADQSIAAKLPESTWQEIIDAMLGAFKKGEMAAGLAQAITSVGEILAQHFPRAADDKNELGDHLILKD